MKPSLYFIKEQATDNFMHGGIGISDAEKILEREGFNPLFFPAQFVFTLKGKFLRTVYLLKLLLSIPPSSIVVFIFPLHARMNQILLRFLKIKRVHIICFVGDINGLKSGNNKLLESEIRKLSRFEYFIVHNAAMANYLQENGIRGQMETIEFFDFLTSPSPKSRFLSGTIVFAGNLGKSGFLEKLDKVANSQVSFHLYGPGLSERVPVSNQVIYKGTFPPYELPAALLGSFGLVWDGDDITGPVGSLGEYMRFISHHKLSLYILSGLPIIAPSFAGSAELINRYQIGFTIDNLDEIKSRIVGLSQDEYDRMRNNMHQLSSRISAGNCLTSALKKIVDRINS